jgi:hypothetical protein
VNLNPPPPPAPVVTKNLCTITFDRDKLRPTRVDNEAKACLDDIALTEQQNSGAKLAIVGNSAPVKVRGRSTQRKQALAEKETLHRAALRAVNEKDYLVKEKGLDPSTIAVYTGQDGTNSDQTVLIPTGANLDTNGLTPVDETEVKPIPRKPLGVRHAHHHHKKAASSSTNSTSSN